MAITDPIANFLTVVRNGQQAKHETVTTPASNITIHIAEILKAEKFIRDVKVMEDGNKRTMKVYLRYFKNGKPVIRSIQRISKPGLRRYVDWQSTPRVLNGLGIAIISTSQGVLTDRAARENHLGGEVLCQVT